MKNLESRKPGENAALCFLPLLPPLAYRSHARRAFPTTSKGHKEQKTKVSGNKPAVCFPKKEVFTEDTKVSLSEKLNFWRIPHNPWSIFALSDFVMQTLLTECCVLCFFTIMPSRFKAPAFPSGVPRYLFIAPGFIACVSPSQVVRFS